MPETPVPVPGEAVTTTSVTESPVLPETGATENVAIGVGGALLLLAGCLLALVGRRKV